MTKRKHEAYTGMFHYWHNNPPPPFNPDFKPNAAKAMTIAVAQLEAEGWYARTTLAERQATTVLHDRYEKVLKELDGEQTQAK
jgi:hypothetical protein